MTNAYRCDGCGEFSEGRPERVWYGVLKPLENPSAKSDFGISVDLCPGCKTSLDEAVKSTLELLEKPDLSETGNSKTYKSARGKR